MEVSVTPETTYWFSGMPAKVSSAGFGWAHGALDGLSGGRTRTVTVSATLSNCPSLTVSANTRSVRTEGAVRVGVAVVAPVSVTASPPVCVHR